MKKLFLIFLLVSPAFGQTFAGTAGSDIFIPSPFRFCMGVDNFGDNCAVQSKNQEMQWSGSVDFKWAFRTVGTLPAASALNLGRTYEVLDGQSGTDCTSGGGSAIAICTSNGSTWNALGSSGSGSGSGGVPNTLPNCTATGTTLNSGVSFSTQVINSVTTLCAQTSAVSSNVVVGVATSGAGTSGSVAIAYSGYANCVFDNQTTQGDYVVASASNAGQCSDIGAGKPSGTVEVIGIVASTNSGGGTLANVLVNPLSLYTPGGTNNSGNVNNAAQFRLPFYSASGNTNVLSGDSNCSLTSGFLTGCLGITIGNGGTTGAITYGTGVQPSLPVAGNGTTYIDSGTNQFTCVLSNGTSCTPGPYVATASGMKCDGSTDDTSAFNTLLSTISTTQATIQFPLGKKCVIGTATVPSNVMLDFSPGSAISEVTSHTLSIEGGISNPDSHQIFYNAYASQGTVDPTTSNTQIKVVYPEWWGAVAGGNATTNQSAIQAAIIGTYGSNRTNGSGNDIFNRELRFGGQYSVNGTLNVYHMIGFVWSCGNRNGCGLIETASNHTLINGQSVAYGAFKDMTFGTTQAQNAASPLVSLDYNASQGSDIAVQFIDFDHDNFSGSQQGQIGVQIAPSGGTAQGSNISFTNDQFSSFNQACLMIGNGSNGTPSAQATNAISIRVAGGDFADCNAYGVANYGGGLLDINGTTFEDGLDSTISGARAQTGYDMFCYIAVSGEFCTAENVRSESLWLVGGFGWVLNNVYNLDQIHVLAPAATPAVGALIQGSSAADGVYYQVTGSTSGASGLGTAASPRTASSGTGTTIVDSVGGLTVNAWTGWQVSYVTPNSSLQYCVITSNTANTFTCSAGWQDRYLNKTISNPTNGTQYIVEPNWGTQTTSGGITWGAVTKTDLGCSACGGVVNAAMNNVFIPGVQIAGPQTSTRVNINSTRADAFSLGGQGYLTYGINDEPTTLVAGLASGGPAGGGGQININYIRKPFFYQTSSTGIPGAGAAVGATNGQAYVVGPQRQDCWIGSPTTGVSSLGVDICEGVSVGSTANTGAWYIDNASKTATPKRLNFDPSGNLSFPGAAFSIVPSGDTSGGTDGNTITSACVAGAVIWLAPSSVGTYYIGKSNANNITVGAACTIKGAGPGPTVIQSEDTTADWVTVNFNNISNNATPPTPMPSGCLIDGITLIADPGNTVTAGAGLRVGTNGSGYTYGCLFNNIDIKGAFYNVRQDPGLWMDTFQNMQLSMATSGDCVYFDTPSPGGDATWTNDRMIGASAGSPCNFLVNRSDTNLITHLKFNNGKFVFAANNMSNLMMDDNNVEGAANCAYDFSAGSPSNYGMMEINGSEFELTGGNPELFFPICSPVNVQRLKVVNVCNGTIAGTPAKCGDFPIRGFQAYDDFSDQTTVALDTTETNDIHPWTRTFQSVWSGALTINPTGSVTGSTIGSYYVNTSMLTPNYTVAGNCTDPGSGAGWCAIGSRLQSPAAGTLAGYACLFIQGTGVKLDSFSGATPTVTQIGTTDTTFTSGTHTIAITTSNTKITCSIDGIPSANATGTDSTYTTAGFAWMGINQASGSGYLVNGPFTAQ